MSGSSGGEAGRPTTFQHKDRDVRPDGLAYKLDIQRPVKRVHVGDIGVEAWERQQADVHAERVRAAMAQLQPIEYGAAIRHPVSYRHDAIHPLFLSYLAQIAAYAGLPEKYGDPLQYRDGRLHGGQGGVNHAREHLGAYQMGVGHDHFPADDPRWQLAAAAYNLMIEFVNLCDGRQPDTWQEKRKGTR
jgi:hypothetical protein